MQNAAKWVINTLSENDYATVVEFSGSASSFSDEMVNADPVQRKRMKDYISGLSSFGGTNMAAGLRQAFEIAERSWKSGKSSKCAGAQMILFLTDGQNSGSEDPLAIIKQLNRELNLRVFTYSLGSGSGGESAKLLKDMACQNQGVWQSIPDFSNNLQQIMAGYFVYLAAGIAHAPIRWSDWFEDGQGLGQLSGACKAVYDRSREQKEGVAVLFGVICQAIHKSTWEGFPDNYEVMQSIVANNKECPRLELSESQLEILRGRISASAQCSNSIDNDETVSGFNAGAKIQPCTALMLAAVALSTMMLIRL